MSFLDVFRNCVELTRTRIENHSHRLDFLSWFSIEKRINGVGALTVNPSLYQNLESAIKQKKMIATIFWYFEGNLLIDYKEPNITFYGIYYEELLYKMLGSIRGKRRRKPTRNMRLLHDNAPVLTLYKLLVPKNNSPSWQSRCGSQWLLFIWLFKKEPSWATFSERLWVTRRCFSPFCGYT